MSQFARPDSNVTQTNFTGGFADIDEASASDADFAWGTNNTAAVLEVGLGDPATPLGAGSLTFRYRIAKTNAGTVDGAGNAVTVTAELYQGTTLIAADAARTADGTWTGYSYTLSGAEAAAITDFTDLRLRFTTSASGGAPANRRGGAVSWAELETPDQGAAPQDLTGAVFTKAPSFGAGVVTLSLQILAGAVFTKAPTFGAATITSVYDLIGTIAPPVAISQRGSMASYTGYNQAHTSLWLNGKIYLGTSQTPFRILRLNDPLNNLSDVTGVTAPGDGHHIGAWDMVYVPSKGKIYVMTQDTDATLVCEVDPDTLAITDVIHDTGVPTSAGQYPAITSDGTYLYTTSDFAGCVVTRYYLSDFTREAFYEEISSLSGYSFPHAIRYDPESGYVFVTGAPNSPAPAWIVRWDPDDMHNPIYTTFQAGHYLATDTMDFFGDDVFVALETQGGMLIRVRKSDLATRYYPSDQNPAFEVIENSGMIWTVHGTTPSRIIARFPNGTQRTTFDVEAGSSMADEIVFDGARHCWVMDYVSPIEVRAFDVIYDVTFGRAPTFGGGTITSIRTLSGGVFTKAPTFPTGTIALGGEGPQNLTGAVFTRAPSFPAATITTVYGLTGAVFTKAGTYPTATVTTTYALSGAVFTKAPAFPTGLIAIAGGTYTSGSVVAQAVVPLYGAAFTKAPTFGAGTITRGAVTLAGAVFARAPSFGAGSVTTSYALSGAVFQRTPTFPQGTITAGGAAQNLTGAVFARAPSFGAGVITQQGGPQTLTGATFQRVPAFGAGVVGRGAVTLSGAVFTRTPTFGSGVITQQGGPQVLGGAVFAKAPTFGAGTIGRGAVTLSGIVFQRAPLFIAGLLRGSNALTGTTFVRVPTFGAGLISRTMIGATFVRSPIFSVGSISTGAVTLVGFVFAKAPTFAAGQLIAGQLGAPVVVPGTIARIAGTGFGSSLSGTGTIRRGNDS